MIYSQLQRIKRAILTAYGVGPEVKGVKLTNENRMAIKGPHFVITIMLMSM